MRNEFSPEVRREIHETAMARSRSQWPGKRICPDCYLPEVSHMAGGSSQIRDCAFELSDAIQVARRVSR